MEEQRTLTLDFVKSLMEPSYTLVWTDYNDNLDNHLDTSSGNVWTGGIAIACGKRRANGMAMRNMKLFMGLWKS